MKQNLDLLNKMRRCGHLLYHRYSDDQSQNRILLLLHRSGPMNQRKLQDEMHIQPGSLSEVVAKVENCGLIERQRSEKDRRNWELRLTEKGREQALEFEKQRAQRADLLFSPLDEKQKKDLESILDILLENWDTAGE